MQIKNTIFEFPSKKSIVMGILNVTPDSFSDGGKYMDSQSIFKRVEQMIDEGADIIDIGGESTRPGYTKISDEEEIDRVCKVVEKVSAQYKIPISVDTYKWKVAKYAIKSGANMINDIWGLKCPDDSDSNMAKVIAKANVPVCIMHNRINKLENLTRCEFETKLIGDLKEQIKIALNNEINPENIILDPGVGFAKGSNENIYSISAISSIKKLGYPVLLGVSNKSIIGNILNTSTDERKEGTIALNVLGRNYGCDIFRVHDVKGNRRALDVVDRVIT